MARVLGTSWWRCREARDRIVSKLNKGEKDRERDKDPDSISVQRAMQTQSSPIYNFSVPSVNTQPARRCRSVHLSSQAALLRVSWRD